MDSGKSSASRSLLGSVSLGYRQKVKQSLRDDSKVRKDERESAFLPLLEMMVLVTTTMTGQLNLASRWLTIFSETLRKAFNDL